MATTDPLTTLSDLRLFLQERVQAFDNSIDTNLGSLFDTVVINPLIDRLSPDPYNTPIRDFILGRLAREFPDLVLQDGEPIDDYAVKIMQILLEAYRRQIKQVSLNQSLANPEQLNEREADNLAANFFVRRRLGGFAVGLARLYYSNPQYSLVTPSNAVFDGSGHRFFPVENQAIQSDRMLFNEENGLYYFDIVVRAESQGAAYNIPINTLTGIEAVTAVVKVTNKASFSEGADKEETTAFLERVETSLTEKSLVTLRGIRARLLDTFENIRLIQAIGFGDPEMMRDILKGTSDSSPYAVAVVSVPDTGGAGTKILDLFGDLFPNTGGVSNFSVVSAGDKVLLYNTTTQQVWERTIDSVVSTTRVKLTADIPDNMPLVWAVFMPAAGNITISDIPGGLADPNTPVVVQSGEVHIGGALDVFVRADAPQQRDITLTGILDGSPLHFGLDLESFGDKSNQRAHITEAMVNKASIPAEDRFGNALTLPLDQIVVEIVDGTDFTSDGTNPWVPTEQDKGRYVQLLGGNAPSDGGPDFGTFKISDVLGKEYFKDGNGRWHTCVRIKIDVASTPVDYESGSISPPFLHHTTSSNQGVFDLSVRLLEEASVKDRVRDRDNSTIAIAENVPNPGDPVINAGVDFDALGASIGDSVVLETGDDAGIYSIRRILSWLGTNDTIILDRDLTRTVSPTGGTGSGIRYRIADELNIDLVSPKVTKIPLGGIFLGDDLSCTAGNTVVSVSGSTNFLLAGVEAGDVLEILEGDNTGKYGIVEVTGTTATLDAPAINTAFSQSFSAYKSFSGVSRPMVRVKTIELLDSNSQPTGIKIPYGSPIDARVLGTLSNRAEGNIVESYSGELENNGAGLYDLQDATVDFVSEGVTTEHRLNILSGSSIESYNIIAVGTGDGLPSNNHIRVAPVASGGIQFVVAETGVHYSVGLPSAGILRLYFLEPTSVEIQTGLSGGRVNYEAGGETKKFQFSSVSGYSILPAGGSNEETPRDLRLVRNYTASPYESILELTDVTRPGVFQLELQEGDVVEVNEHIQPSALSSLSGTWNWPGGSGATGVVTASSASAIRVGMRIGVVGGQLFEITAISGSGPYSVTVSNPNGWTFPSGLQTTERVATFEQLGIFGKPAGLRTVTGSNLVEVPDNSLIDFVAMNRLYPLAGQILIIDSGPDSGRYVIEEVVSSKKLRLNTVMTSTTASVLGGDTGAPIRNATLTDTGTKSRITDTVDGTQLKVNNLPGYFITIFESTRGDLDGSWEVTDLLTSPPVANTIEIDTLDELVNEGSTFASLDPFSIGMFSWVKTSTDTNVEQPFGIYREVPSEFTVEQVATKRTDITGIRRGTVSIDTGVKNTLTDAQSGFVMNAKRGDMIEVLSGPNAGVYALKQDSSVGVAKIHAYPEFPVVMSNVPYRIWGGLHGSTRMVTVGPKDSFNGKMSSSESMPYRIRRRGVERVSSTVMETNFDGLLYYIDVQIESQGAGDDLNLEANARMVVSSGVRADGYQYNVQNNVLTFSTLEEVSLAFDRRFLPVGNSDSPENLTEVSGRNIQITYETSTTVKLVDDLLRSEADRPINASPLARHFLPSYVFTNFTYSGGVSETEVGTDMEDYINKLGAQTELEISDLEALVTKRGATYVKHPLLLVTVTHDLDRKLVVDRSEDKLGGLNTVPFNGTGRIACFFATVGEGLTLVRES